MPAWTQDAEDAEAARIETARRARQDKIPSLRRVVRSLIAVQRSSQAALAARVGWLPSKLTDFMQGSRRLQRAGPASVPIGESSLACKVFAVATGAPVVARAFACVCC